MNVFFILVLFLLGIILIVKGGDYFVDAAAWIAEVSGIPKFLIGATVVSFATTLPELLVSLLAALDGKVEMAAGNAIGSVTANVGLIMGISIVAIPAVFQRAQLAFKGILLLLICTLLYICSFGNALTVGQSVVLLLLFAVFMAESIVSAKKSMHTDAAQKQKPTKAVLFGNIGKFVIGVLGIVVGARLLVDNGSALARLIGVPERVIGVTMIAVGTSLPELVTTITAVVKKQASLSIGNIIGANIIDLSVILPVCALASGGSLPISNQTIYLDLPVCLAVIFIAVIPALLAQKFRRWQGVILLAGYIAYLGIVSFA